MDPLSILVSAVTLSGTLLSTISAVNSALQLPEEVDRLRADVDDIRRLLQACGNTRNTALMLLDAPRARLDSISETVDRLFPPQWNKGRRRSLVNSITATYRRHRIRHLVCEITATRLQLCTAVGILSLQCNQSLLALYAMETSSSFFPEQYGYRPGPSAAVYIFAVIEVERSEAARLHQIFLFFAKSPRCWARIIIMARTRLQGHTWEQKLQSSWRPGLMFEILPGNTQRQVERLLREKSDAFCDTVTRLDINFTAGPYGDVGLEQRVKRMTEEAQAFSSMEASAMLEFLVRQQLPLFNEGQVIFVNRLKTCLCLVGIGHRMYIERKRPFPYAAGPGRNLEVEYFAELRLLLASQACSHVARFAGAIVSDDYSCIRGYLVELPGQAVSLKRAMAQALRSGTMISWERRLRWIRSITTAMIELHSRQLVAGVTTVQNVWLDAADNVVMLGFTHGGSHLSRPGYRPPELRGNAVGDEYLWRSPSIVSPDTVGRGTTASSDIFQLGIFIWQLAQHLPCSVGVFCPAFGCSAVPRYRCRLPHTDPIELPACTRAVPACINECVTKCRMPVSSARASAVQILRLLPDTNHSRIPPTPAVGAVHPSQLISSDCTCDECGSFAFDVVYHCEICHQGDFDLCSVCYGKGLRCYGQTHVLVKRVCILNQWVNYWTPDQSSLM